MTPAPRALAERHVPLLTAAARTAGRRLPASDMGDLMGWGAVGLMEAAHRFDPARGCEFVTPALRRIRGAIIDGVHRDNGGDGPIATKKRARAVKVTRVPDTRDSAEQLLVRGEAERAVRAALAALPRRERALVELVDLREMAVQDAAQALGLKTSWASRLRSAALVALREQLGAIAP